ncbi:Cleavage stimulation factor subunit 2 [Datura stramonium]|uniref:Cleavage stimulation factor subunit 2 n=1 Tax=Datura stramonium TaxID=4076 RepID=A0ABS8RNE3_DATST|nr:Cleavage stimulation factor subunit 2 [Datura stramonium]
MIISMRKLLQKQVSGSKKGNVNPSSQNKPNVGRMYVDEQYGGWRRECLEILQRKFDTSTGCFAPDKEILSKLQKSDIAQQGNFKEIQKSCMPFLRFKKDEVLAVGLQASDLRLPLLQTPDIRRSAAPRLQPLLLDSQRSQQLTTQSLPPSLLPRARPQIQLAQPRQNQVLQSQLPTSSRILPSIQPQVIVSISPPVQVGTSAAIKQQTQPSFLQQAWPVASTNFTCIIVSWGQQIQAIILLHQCVPHYRNKGNPSAVSGIMDNTNKTLDEQTQAPNNLSLITRPTYPSGLPEEKRGAANNLDLLSRPLKTAGLNDGISYALPDASVSTPLSGRSTQASSAAETSNPDKQGSQAQLPSDVESALLQQVLSLTLEQLRSLPPDQQKQVIQLQQMLWQPNFNTRKNLRYTCTLKILCPL